MQIDLYDSGGAVPWPDDWNDIKGLNAFLDKAWKKRPIKLLDDEDENARRNTYQKFFKLDAQGICATKYVGFVQYGGLRVNVYPGVFNGAPSIAAADQIWHVLKWLSYARRIHFPFSRVPLDNLIATDWIEALIYLFANYTHKVLSATSHFAYQEVVEELAFVRGGIAMPEYIRANLATGRHQYITCRHEPFLYDNGFNRIVKHTIRLLQRISKSTDNKQRLSKMLFLLDEVSDMHCSTSDCDKVKVNRLFPEVDTIRNMCRMFLQHRSGSVGSDDSNICLLLPMEVVFEQYVGGFLETYFKASQQASGMSLAKTGKDFATNVFQMRHDILLPYMIIDTKYKYRTIAQDGKAGVSQIDLYQMVAYCYRRAMRKGMLLYPQRAGFETIDPVPFRIPTEKDNNPPKPESEDFMEVLAAIDITEPNTSRQEFANCQRYKFGRLLTGSDSIMEQ